jgi:hypothetical protein
MTDEDEELKPLADGNMNIPPRKPPVAVGLADENEGLTSGQIAKFFKEEIAPFFKHERQIEFAVCNSIIEYFRLDEDIQSKQYDKGIISDINDDLWGGDDEKLFDLRNLFVERMLTIRQ